MTLSATSADYGNEQNETVTVTVTPQRGHHRSRLFTGSE
jgi:hypothetical protein